MCAWIEYNNTHTIIPRLINTTSKYTQRDSVAAQCIGDAEDDVACMQMLGTNGARESGGTVVWQPSLAPMVEKKDVRIHSIQGTRAGSGWVG